MVPARNAGGTCQGCNTLSKAHRHFSHLRPALCLGWPLWFLWFQDALQQKPLENLEEQDVLLIGPGGHVPEPLPVRQRKRETMDLRFYIYQVSSVFQGHSSSTNLKYQRRNWVKAGSTRLPKTSWKKKFLGVGSLVSYLVVLLVTVSYTWQYVCSREKSFEMNALVVKFNVKYLHLIRKEKLINLETQFPRF